MPAYKHHEVDDVRTPASDYSFATQATSSTLMPSPGSGMFPFSQTGPADLGGSTWDSSTVEGTQNYSDYHQDQGAGDAYSPYTLGQVTPTRGEEVMNDFHNKWHVSAAPEASATPSAEPMRRITSRSSSGSPRQGPSSSALAQASQLQYEHMTTGNASVATAAGRIGDVNQYLDLEAMSVSSRTLYPALAPSAYPDGLPYGPVAPALAQHVDPTCTQMQMDFEPGMAVTSPSGSWDSYSPTFGRSPSPIFDESINPWMNHLGSVSSPTETTGSSPDYQGHSPQYVATVDNSEPLLTPNASHLTPASHTEPSTRISRKYSGGQQLLAPADDRHYSHMMPDEYSSSLQPAFGAPRMAGVSVSDGESSARDHALYKHATPQSDGLFHCPWEGQEGCTHKPEKLKCNYDKFVDSHLKPYRCKMESCENSKFSSTACLLRHEREAHGMHGHGEKPYMCTYDGCDRAQPGNGFPRHWNLKDHMKRVHNDVAPPSQLAVSPPPSGSSSSGSHSGSTSGSSGSQAQAKSRKRKKDGTSQDSTPTSSRKSSSKSTSSQVQTQASAHQSLAPARAEELPRIPKSVQRWHEHQQKLASLVSGFTDPYDPNMVHYLTDAQEHVSSMLKISSRKGHGHHHGSRGEYRRSYMDQSG